MDPIVPAPFRGDPYTRWPRRRAVLWSLLGVTVLVLLSGLIAAATLTVDYYAVSPGSARETESLVVVSDVDTFPAEGQVLFTTVSIEKMTWLERQRQDWFPDPDVQVISEEDYLGNRTSDENQQFNQQLMQDSKDVAAYVALEHLGYEVSITGSGAQIVDVADDTPAEGAGLNVGDTIVALDGTPVGLNEELVTLVGNHAPGDTVTFTVQNPAGESRDITVTLTAREDDASAGFLGVVSVTRELDYHLPFPVSIDSGTVGGPSAGLAFTLALLDVLTPGELTGGEAVAVTGTINADGSVGRVGGVAQKAAVVRDSGAELFLVPEAEFDEVAERIGDDVRVVPVATLDDALQALSSLEGSNALALPQQGAQSGT